MASNPVALDPPNLTESPGMEAFYDLLSVLVAVAIWVAGIHRQQRHDKEPRQ